jgi:hypothetical protein
MCVLETDFAKVQKKACPSFLIFVPWAMRIFYQQDSKTTLSSFFFVSVEHRAGIFKLLRSLSIDSKESTPPAYVAWRAGIRQSCSYSVPSPDRLFKNSSTVHFLAVPELGLSLLYECVTPLLVLGIYRACKLKEQYANRQSCVSGTIDSFVKQVSKKKIIC